MGKPTWVIVPLLPYHIWAYGDRHSPWYQNTTKVFRQKVFGNWNETFELLEKEFIELRRLAEEYREVEKILLERKRIWEILNKDQ